MGIKLMVEIFDHWQDAGLTVGERSDLLVLAENANDGTRLTFGPVHAEYILRRAGKTANGWKNAIGKLVAKKVLTVHTPGRIKQAAVYRLERLCPESRHDGYKGACRRSPERVTPEVTLSEKEGHLSDDPMGHPSGDPLGQEGHLTGAERVTSQVTPTPLYPSFKISSNTPTSSPAEPAEPEPAVEPDVTDGGGGGVSDLRSIAEHITASLDYQDQVPDKQQLQALTAALVAVLEKGWTMEVLAPYLRLGTYRPGNPVAFYLAKLTKNLPDTVPTPPAAAARGGVRGPMPTAEDYESLTVDSVFFDGRPDPADGGMWERAMARARGGTATLDGGHQPYSNPQDDSVYDEPWPLSTADRRAAQGLALAAKYRAEEERAAWPQWCGEPECEPIGRMREHVDAGGLKRDEPCPRCHPERARAA